MILGRQNVSETNAHHGAPAQLGLGDISAARGVDSLDDPAVRLVDLVFIGRDAALRRPVGAARRPYLRLPPAPVRLREKALCPI